MILSGIKYKSKSRLLPFFLAAGVSAFSQAAPKANSSEPRESVSDHVFVKVEQEVGFPGGEKAFKNYISKRFNVGKLSESLPDNIQDFLDSAIVSLVIKKDGTLKDIETKGGFSPVFREEIKQVLLSSGAWKPAMACGFYVNAYRSYVFYYRRNADMESVWIRESTSDEVKKFPAGNH